MPVTNRQRQAELAARISCIAWFWITGAVVGAVAFRLLVAGAIRAGLNADALKLVTAAFVLAVLIVPQLGGRITRRAEGARSRG